LVILGWNGVNLTNSNIGAKLKTMISERSDLAL